MGSRASVRQRCCLHRRAIVVIAAVVQAIAGPPFVTDDPEPVEYRHWEIYVESEWSSANRTISGTFPALEANYGLVPDVQIAATGQLSVNSAIDGHPDYGPGDLEFGIKYRFIKESDGRPQVSFYPAIEIPTEDSSKGLGLGTANLLLPLFFQKSFGPFTTYGGGGYQATIGRPWENLWFFGWEAQRDLSDAVTLGVELVSASKQDGYAGIELGFNIGAVVNLTPQHHILASIGRDIYGANQMTCYLGYLLVVGPDK